MYRLTCCFACEVLTLYQYVYYDVDNNVRLIFYCCDCKVEQQLLPNWPGKRSCMAPILVNTTTTVPYLG